MKIDMGDFTITGREVIVSIAIIAIMIIVGVNICTNIKQNANDKNEVYMQAYKTDNSENFQYAMDTNIGNAFIYGDLITIDPVTYDEIDGEYMYVSMTTEKYTKHTRQVQKSRRVQKLRTVNGKTEYYWDTEYYWEYEDYWTWDAIYTERKKATTISFNGIIFPIRKIELPQVYHIDTISAGHNLRHVYVGVSPNHTGTIYTQLENGTISNNTVLYENMTIDQTLEYLKSDGNTTLFWIIWFIITGVAVFGFCYIDNTWLE